MSHSFFLFSIRNIGLLIIGVLLCYLPVPAVAVVHDKGLNDFASTALGQKKYPFSSGQHLLSDDLRQLSFNHAIALTTGRKIFGLSVASGTGSKRRRKSEIKKPDAESVRRAILKQAIPASAFYSSLRGDLISLHYDHMPDPDDGHATVAARTVTGHFGITPHVVAGTHSFPMNRKNAFMGPFQEAALDVMTAAWGEEWLNARNDKNSNEAPNPSAVKDTAKKWYDTLQKGGHVWVAEGGPSDFTAAVLKHMQRDLNYTFRTPRSIHVIQHGAEPCKKSGTYRLNELNTGEDNLRFVQKHTDYKILGNGNCYQVSPGKPLYPPTANFRSKDIVFNQRFKDAAAKHVYASAWAAAFRFWDPVEKGKNTALRFSRGELIVYPWQALDFSDTVELMYILGIGPEVINNCRDFLEIFLSAKRRP